MASRGRGMPQQGMLQGGMRPVGMPHMQRGLLQPGGPQGLRPMGGPLGPGVPGGGPQNVIAVLEQNLMVAQNDLQRLMQENQRVAATHVALRQELSATQQELQRVQQVLLTVQTEKDIHIKTLLEKTARMEQDMQAVDALKVELQGVRLEAQQLAMRRQEAEQGRIAIGQQLTAANQQLQAANNELQRATHSMNPLRQENQNLRQEVTQARTALEYERKANADQMEQRKTMEKKMAEMAHELGKLRAELSMKSGSGGGAGGYHANSGVQMGTQQAGPQTNLQQQQTGAFNSTGAGVQQQQPPLPGEARPSSQAVGYAGQGAWQGQQTQPQQAAGYRAPAPRGVIGGPGAASAAADKGPQASTQGQQSAQGYFQQAANGAPTQQVFQGQGGGAGYSQWPQQGAGGAAPATGGWQAGSTQTQQQFPPSQSQGAEQAAAQFYNDVYGGQYNNGQQGGATAAAAGQPGGAAKGQSAGAAPLPAGWTEHQAADGRVFYFNTTTGATQWEKPDVAPPLPPLPAGPAKGAVATPTALPSIQSPVQGGGRPGASPPQYPQGVNVDAGNSVGANPSGGSAAAARGYGQGMMSTQPPAVQQSKAYVAAAPVFNRAPVSPPQGAAGGSMGVKQGSEAAEAQAMASAPPGANLFVFGLPDEVNDRSLSQMFADFGQVLYARVGLEKETGRSRGFGFVSMDSAQAAEKAIQAMNGKLVGGRRIKVERKRGEPPQQGHNGPGPLRGHQGQDRRGYAPY